MDTADQITTEQELATTPAPDCQNWMALHDMGFSLIPLKAAGKVPYIAWQAHQKRRAPRSKIEAWYWNVMMPPSRIPRRKSARALFASRGGVISEPDFPPRGSGWSGLTVHGPTSASRRRSAQSPSRNLRSSQMPAAGWSPAIWALLSCATSSRMGMNRDGCPVTSPGS